jgi:hypothetical protein
MGLINRKPVASATSKTTDFASMYYVENQFGFSGCPDCWRGAVTKG